jgi:hypothetical protein
MEERSLSINILIRYQLWVEIRAFLCVMWGEEMIVSLLGGARVLGGSV